MRQRNCNALLKMQKSIFDALTVNRACTILALRATACNRPLFFSPSAECLFRTREDATVAIINSLCKNLLTKVFLDNQLYAYPRSSSSSKKSSSPTSSSSTPASLLSSTLMMLQPQEVIITCTLLPYQEIIEIADSQSRILSMLSSAVGILVSLAALRAGLFDMLLQK